MPETYFDVRKEDIHEKKRKDMAKNNLTDKIQVVRKQMLRLIMN